MAVLEAVSSYCAGSITKEEADEIISKYDISDKVFKENIKGKIKEIQKKDRASKGSLIDKESQQEKTEAPKEESDADTSVGLMSPKTDGEE